MNSAPPTEHKPPQKQWGAHHRASGHPHAHHPAGAAPAQARNPLHGITLKAMVVAPGRLLWLGRTGAADSHPLLPDRPQRGLQPQVLRKTPWAREKVESLYLFMLRERKRNA